MEGQIVCIQNTACPENVCIMSCADVGTSSASLPTKTKTEQTFLRRNRTTSTAVTSSNSKSHVYVSPKNEISNRTTTLPDNANCFNDSQERGFVKGGHAVQKIDENDAVHAESVHEIVVTSDDSSLEDKKKEEWNNVPTLIVGASSLESANVEEHCKIALCDNGNCAFEDQRDHCDTVLCNEDGNCTFEDQREHCKIALCDNGNCAFEDRREHCDVVLHGEDGNCAFEDRREHCDVVLHGEDGNCAFEDRCEHCDVVLHGEDGNCAFEDRREHCEMALYDDGNSALDNQPEYCDNGNCALNDPTSPSHDEKSDVQMDDTDLRSQNDQISLNPELSSRGRFKKHRRKGRSQRMGRKWKPIHGGSDDVEISFKMSLFPRVGNYDGGNSDYEVSNSEEEEDELTKEFKIFLESNELDSHSKDDDAHDSEISVTVDIACIFQSQELSNEASVSEACRTTVTCDDESEEHVIHDDERDRSPIKEPNVERSADDVDFRRTKTKTFFSSDELEYCPSIAFYEDKIPRRTLESMDRFSDSAAAGEKRLRTKKKWRETKARVQIKSRHCRSVGNCVHGQTFYVHHRVVKLMTMEIETTRFRAEISVRRIDETKGRAVGFVRTKNPDELFATGGKTVWRTAANGRSVVSAHAPAFAADVFNVDGDIADELVNILITLQHRDLMPEDYELLLQLDDRVKPKTIEATVLENLRTEEVVTGDDGAAAPELCAVCLEPYEVGQTKKFLPCGHCFHATCIDGWLSNSSMNCPLDGMPVSPV